MKKKTSLFFFIFVFTCLFVLQSFNSYQIYSSTNDLVKNDLQVKSEIVTLRSYDALGEFISFTPSGTYDIYDDTLSNVEFNGTAAYDCNATFDFDDISSSTVINVSYTVGIYCIGTPFNVTGYVNYTDGTHEQIGMKGAIGFAWVWLTFTADLDSGKIVDQFVLDIWTGGSVNAIFRLTELIFYGYMPEVANVSYELNNKQGDNTYYSAELNHVDSTLNQNITFQYSGSSNINEQIMQTDWIGDNKYFKEMTFSTIGTYRFILTIRNNWNITLSEYYVFYIGEYPQSSYLSLFSSVDGFPLESKDYKIYLGETEEVSLVNFRDYHGNWSQIYAGSVNASLIDNYIKIQAENDGLKTTFDGGIAHDTLVYNTLLFDCKVLNATRVVVIYNPEYHEKDYYLDFNSSMANYWYEIEVPFFLFNQYENVTNDWLLELGFWIKNSTMEISNIRIATHYNKTYLQESSIQLNMTDSIISNETDSQSYLNSSILTFNSAEFIINTTLNIPDGFNNTDASFENVTIESNSSVSLNNTGHYQAYDSFYSDTIGNIPSKWTTTETSASCRVENEKDGRKKVIHFDDNDAVAARYAAISNTTLMNLENGIHYYCQWVENTTTQFESRLGNTALSSYISIYQDGNHYQIYDGTMRDLFYQNGSLATIQYDMWVYHQFEYNSSANSWNWSISFDGENYERLYQDNGGVDYDLQFNGGASATNFTTWKYYVSYSGIGQVWLDTIDKIDDNGYYENRYSNLIDGDGYYISDIIDFTESVELFNISINSTIPTNTTLDLYISDNGTGSFDNWMNYSNYIGNETQFLKYKVLLNNTNSSSLPIFDNISFNLTTYVYNLSQTFNITYFTHSYASIWNSTNFVNIKTNDSTGTFNFSIYKFNESQYFNQTFNNTSYDLLNFTFDNNTIFDPDNNNTNLYQIYGSSSNPFNISINLINCTTFFNKTLYSGEYNVSLLEEFENLYFYYHNNNSLNLDFSLYNGSDFFKQVDLENSSQWEKYNQSINNTWTHLYFNYSSYENESFWIRELFETKEESYRLISLENRQNPNELVFTQEERTLAILDYFNNTLYRQTYNYTSFIDVALPITTVSFHNYYTDAITIEITRGLGTSIEILVPPDSSISIRVFTTSYLVHARNAELQTLLLEEFSPDQSQNVIFEFGERQSATDPGTDTLQNILIFIIIGLIAFVIAWEIYSRIKARSESKKTNNSIKLVRYNQNKKSRKKVSI